MAPLVTEASGAVPAGRWRKPPTVDELASILNQRKTLYVHRPLKNGQALIDWARSQGFTKTLPADGLHVTLAYSKEPVDWNDPGINERPTSSTGGARSVEPLGDEGAIVLRFESPELSQRWKQFVDAGAHWQYDEFRPHVSITYDGKDVDLSKVDPYMGPLDFDGEVFEEIKGSGTAKAKRSMTGDEAAFNEGDHPRNHGKFASSAGGSGGETKEGEKPAKRPPLGERIKQHAETIKKHGAATREWIEKEGGAGKVLANVAKDPRTQHAISYALQSLVSHGTGLLHHATHGAVPNIQGLDPGTWALNEQIFEHAVHHIADVAAVTAIQAKTMMRKGVEALLALRKGAKPPVATDEDEDGITATLEALLDILADDDQDGDANKEITATDSALRLALDRDSVRETDRDGRMRVSSAHISKACVNPYKGHEIPDWEGLGLDPNKIYYLLRDPEELARAAPTFNGVQLLRKHIPVSAEDHQPYDVVGTTGTEAKFNDPYLDNSLTIWTKEGIDFVESEAQKELSCGYHYRADMTPGNFGGMRFDGVMRDIVGNHVALVKDGRAGPDVVVGDSNEEITMSTAAEQARKINALAMRQVSLTALATYLKPRLAMDSGVSLAKAFEGVTGKTFKEKKPEIAKSLRDQAKGKIAKDANLDDVEKVLTLLEKHEIEGGDESVSEPQHKAMEAAAHGASNLDIPKKVGEEFSKADKGKTFDAEPFFAKMREKGMSEDDISALSSVLPKPAATDEAEETEEEKKKREEKERADKEAAAAKDNAMKDMVSKPAMDAAITAAVATERERHKGLNAALTKVRPIVGELSMAFDSGADVFRHVLKMKGVPNVDKIHESALETVVDMQPKAGAQARIETPSLGMDSEQVDRFTKRFPGSERIGTA